MLGPRLISLNTHLQTLEFPPFPLATLLPPMTALSLRSRPALGFLNLPGLISSHFLRDRTSWSSDVSAMWTCGTSWRAWDFLARTTEVRTPWLTASPNG